MVYFVLHFPPGEFTPYVIDFFILCFIAVFWKACDIEIEVLKPNIWFAFME